MTATFVGSKGTSPMGLSGLEYHHKPRPRMTSNPENTEARNKTCLDWDFGALGL